MNITAKELSKILNRDGYEVIGGALPWLSEAVPVAQKPVVPTTWRNEREFQRAVVDAYAAWAAINKESAILCHVANENAHKQPGIVAGMPDLVLFAGAERGSLFIELKAGSGKLSTAQREIHYRLQRMGYRVVTVWDSVEEVLVEIERFLK